LYKTEHHIPVFATKNEDLDGIYGITTIFLSSWWFLLLFSNSPISGSFGASGEYSTGKFDKKQTENKGMGGYWYIDI
jgi:hypothetical protein